MIEWPFVRFERGCGIRTLGSDLAQSLWRLAVARVTFEQAAGTEFSNKLRHDEGDIARGG